MSGIADGTLNIIGQVDPTKILSCIVKSFLDTLTRPTPMLMEAVIHTGKAVV
ncbi:hypothetical protein CERZMDRAFT_92007 [Cercospora zeae-maydis SCOH1-5]|uniref:Uncharacterized protein n=1 Tax=Cercospora zeae-maydis SCOH1-5 TaxID=717836 RepID=A0A6A6F0S9_9PEZI|nr:hypothetical protein CERZMDRAFT_92007 [Cercospora zeae-maydis SCOH1-5]